MPLSANTIKLYGPNGQLVGRLVYQGDGVAYQPCVPTPLDEDSFTDRKQPTVEGTSDQSRSILTQGSHLANSATHFQTQLSFQLNKKAHLNMNVYLRTSYHQHKRITLHPVILIHAQCTATPIATCTSVASNPEIHATPTSNF